MTKTDSKVTPDLTSAASALEAELNRFEELSTAATKSPLNTEKNFERAARAMTDAAESHDRVGLNVRALVEAIAKARERQEASAAALQLRANEMQMRSAKFTAMMNRFSALGDEAAMINGLVQDVATQSEKKATQEGLGVVLAQLDKIQSRMAGVVEAAQTLCDEAKADDMVDISRQADSLKQQVHAARNKVRLLHQSLNSKAPS